MAGVQIVVMGFNFVDHIEKPFQVLNRISLHHNSDTSDKRKNLQILAVETIKEQYLNFEADLVYCDEGHGSMQNEILNDWFYKRGEIYKFKGVDFSSKYEIYDYFAQETKHKRMKVMMVYFLQKRFEMGEIMISSLEEANKEEMIDQLMNYSVDRYDSNGQPIFAGVDHILDALMLSVFAIIENYDTIFDKRTGNYVAGFKNVVNQLYDETIKEFEENQLIQKIAEKQSTEIREELSYNIRGFGGNKRESGLQRNIKEFDFDVF